jgi:hypothetical protein
MQGEVIMKRIIGVVAMVLSVGLFLFVPADAQPKKVAITGTVVDKYCEATMGMGGPSHKQCATECVKHGSPLGIKEDKTGNVYLLAGQKGMLYASSGLEKYVEERVTVRGTEFQKDGLKVIVVDSAVPAK